MPEKPIPFRDFAVAQVQARETETPDNEPSYERLMESGWRQFQDALLRDLTNEEVGHVIHAHEEDVALYWFRQWARDGLVQNDDSPNEWSLENDGEKVGVWFDYSGALSRAPHGYSAIYFKRATDEEHASACFHYATDPSNGLVLDETVVHVGPLREYLISHELKVERGLIDGESTDHTFKKHNYRSNTSAELMWVEVTESPDLEGEEV